MDLFRFEASKELKFLVFLDPVNATVKQLPESSR